MLLCFPLSSPSALPCYTKPFLPSSPHTGRYAKMVNDQHQPNTTPIYVSGVLRSNSLSDFSIPLTENIYSNVPPKEAPLKVDRSFSEDPALLPPSPLRRGNAKKDRPKKSPKHPAMKIMHTRSCLPTDPKSLELTNSLPTPLSADEVKRRPVSPRPLSFSSYYPESPPLTPYDMRSTTLPGAISPNQPPVKSSKKKTQGQRGSKPKKGVRWTAKGQSHSRTSAFVST